MTTEDGDDQRLIEEEVEEEVVAHNSNIFEHAQEVPFLNMMSSHNQPVSSNNSSSRHPEILRAVSAPEEKPKKIKKFRSLLICNHCGHYWNTDYNGCNADYP